jgi:hypothetical protein
VNTLLGFLLLIAVGYLIASCIMSSIGDKEKALILSVKYTAIYVILIFITFVPLGIWKLLDIFGI